MHSTGAQPCSSELGLDAWSERPHGPPSPIWQIVGALWITLLSGRAPAGTPIDI